MAMRKKEELSSTNTCMAHAHPEEMVFVLLGRDVAAPTTIRAWVAERLRLGKNVDTDGQIVEALACADTMQAEGRKWAGHPTHYPFGMGEESRRLHREYNRLVAAQRAGAMNGFEVRALTDECSDKGIILVPGGENL
jgi:hypothetical protein